MYLLVWLGGGGGGGGGGGEAIISNFADAANAMTFDPESHA